MPGRLTVERTSDSVECSSDIFCALEFQGAGISSTLGPRLFVLDASPKFNLVVRHTETTRLEDGKERSANTGIDFFSDHQCLGHFPRFDCIDMFEVESERARRSGRGSDNDILNHTNRNYCYKNCDNVA